VSLDLGCQMIICFLTKNPNLGKFWRAFEWSMLVYCMTIWNISWPFGIIYGRLVYIVCGHLLYFSKFGVFGLRKIWQPCIRHETLLTPDQVTFCRRHFPFCWPAGFFSIRFVEKRSARLDSLSTID
jgi:hypothetical protein